MVDVLLGLQWGDEGKGKIVDVLTPKYDLVCRFQGGPNAGHTLIFNNEKHVLHTIPSGIFHKKTINIIGNGVVIDPITMHEEISTLNIPLEEIKKRLIISNKAHLILPTHRVLDKAYEQKKGNVQIGSTLKGIGPTYTDKTCRKGLRIGDIFEADFEKRYLHLKAKHLEILKLYDYDNSILEEEQKWFESIEYLRQFSHYNTEYILDKSIKDGKQILAEGAQGTMLDIDFGTYPYVTSSNTISAATSSGLGISPKQIGKVYGICKAYCSRVGNGPFPTEQINATGEKLQEVGGEFGATTGRPRRCGWLDLPALKYAVMINGVTDLILTKVDVLEAFETINLATHYNINGNKTNELPYELNDAIQPVYKTFNSWEYSLNDKGELHPLLLSYVAFLENELQIPVTFISTGPDRKQIVQRD